MGHLAWRPLHRLTDTTMFRLGRADLMTFCHALKPRRTSSLPALSSKDFSQGLHHLTLLVVHLLAPTPFKTLSDGGPNSPAETSRVLRQKLKLQQAERFSLNTSEFAFAPVEWKSPWPCQDLETRLGGAKSGGASAASTSSSGAGEELPEGPLTAGPFVLTLSLRKNVTVP